MNVPSEDIKDLLVDAGLGLIHGTNLFIGEEPSDPDNTVTIFDTPGWEQELTLSGQDDGENYFYPSIQIRVRNRSYQTAYELINDIRTELHGIAQQIVNGAVYSMVRCSQEPFSLGYDQHQRSWWVVNFDIQRKRLF